MPTASGFIKSLSGGSKFTSTFVIDDIQYHFSGNINPTTPEFESNNATLEYTNKQQLTAQRQIEEGKVGTNNISLSLKNGPTIEGILNSPIHPAVRVSGTGTWAQD
ncbi:hypothetical protein F4813DRAFT_397225 [Daldinia decipiens]|uniref:uncharacterized protein n=1 Tax=Daldinia decipiens TaxID=326647 RepID=UPI0020C4D6A7|nr:uncharacterized protein F4813DRAFT_397225 [Daldinia decipiens]KAI1656982.1 hypothetical protein F4813DRAFT_397225 [Daldinia decipiens]